MEELIKRAERSIGLGDVSAGEEALREATRAEGTPTDRADAHDRLGRVRLARGDDRGAAEHFAAAQELRSALRDDDPIRGVDLVNAGELAHARGDYRAAADQIAAGVELLRGTGRAADLARARALVRLGAAQRALGEPEDAERSLRESLALSATLGEDAAAIAAEALVGLALLLRKVAAGDALAMVTDAFVEAGRVLGPSHYFVAEAVRARAGVLNELGAIGEAERSYETALRLLRATLGPRCPSCAETLYHIGRLRLRQGDAEGGQRLLTDALEIQRDVLGLQHPAAATTAKSLGDAHRARGQFDEARTLYEEALEVQRLRRGPDHSTTAAILVGLAISHLEQGRPRDAIEPLTAALAIHENALGPHHLKVGETLCRLAQAYAATERWDRALEAQMRGMKVEDRLTSALLVAGSDRQRSEHIARLVRSRDALLSMVFPHLHGTQDAVRSAYGAALRRKGIAAEWASSRLWPAMAHRRSSPPELKELEEVLRAIAREVTSGPTLRSDERQRQVEAWHERREQLERHLAGDVPAVGLLRALSVSSRAAITAALPDGAALVEYIRFDDACFKPTRRRPHGDGHRYVAFVVRAGESDNITASTINPKQAAEVEQLVARQAAKRKETGTPALRWGEAEPGGLAEKQRIGENLREILFDGLEGSLGGRVRVILCPDGPLYSVPFAALPARRGPGHLADRYHFSQLRVARDAARVTTRSPTRPGRSLVVGDPDFNLDGDELESTWADPTPPVDWDGPRQPMKFPPLPGTREEASRIAEMLGTSAWLGPRALEAAVKASRSPRMMHLASYAFVFSEHDPPAIEALRGAPSGDHGPASPMSRAGLALAGANTHLRGGTLRPDADDGLLLAEEIAELDLTGTEMVVISGTATLGAPGQVGDSIGALAAAFNAAGARTLVMPLYETDDRRTTSLMTDFYRRVLDGTPRAEALREAQLAMRESDSDDTTWGAFVSIGDLSPLSVEYGPFQEAQNPYTVGRVATDSMFVGRRDILDKVVDNLRPGAAGNVLVLRGQRRTGKTSVLVRLREILDDELPGMYVPILVDLQGTRAATSDAQFLNTVARSIGSNLRRYHELKVPVPPLSEFKEFPTGVFEQYLADVMEAVGDRRLLLMLDEFESMAWLVETGRVAEEVLDVFRSIMQHSGVLFLLAGTHRLRRLTGGYWSVFFNLAVPLDLGTLDEQDTRWLINEPARRWYTVDPAAASEIVRVAGRHPYFTQLVLMKLVDVRNAAKVNLVTTAHVHDAVGDALSTGDDQIGYAWTETDCQPDERLVMGLLAERGSECLSVREIRSRLADAGLEASVVEAVEGLRRRAVIQGDDDALTFVVPLLNEWIRARGFAGLTATKLYNDDLATADSR